MGSTTIRYRSLSATKLGNAADLFLSTLTDLARRNGLPAPTSFTRASVDPLYAHLHRHGIFEAAFEEERLVVICAGVVRGEIFFLSMFWTAADCQRRGIGAPLLARVWKEAQRRGARQAFTWSSVDYTAITTYLRLGMLPVGPILSFAGPPRFGPEDGEADSEPLALDFALELDGEVWGAPREIDHREYFARAASARQVRLGGELVGYFYADRGAIGPAAWRSPDHATVVLDRAARVAALQAPEIRVAALGPNTDAIRFALDTGLRLVGTSHFLRTSSFGHFERYVPSGPGLF